MGRLKRVCGGVTAVLGLGLLAVGISLKWSIFPKLLESTVYDNIKLEEGTEGFDAFVNPPVPVYMNFKFFHVTNPENVANDGAKPILKEVGPYIYKETRRKEDLLEVEGDKMQFSQYMSYSFDQERTNEQGCKNGEDFCTKDDNITVINGALVGVMPQLIDMLTLLDTLPENITQFVNDTFHQPPKELVLTILNEAFARDKFMEEVFKEVSISDLIFDGYETGLLSAIFNLDELVVEAASIALNYEFTSIEEVLALIQFLVPNATELYESLRVLYNEKLLPELNAIPQIAGGTFGIFKGKNATKVGSYYLINTGKYEKHNFMELEQVNGRETLPDDWWPFVPARPSGQESGIGGICHEIYGTNGEQFPPFIDSSTQLWIYVGELCRSLWMTFREETDLLGIPVYRYRPAADVFAMDNPNNFCYCPEFFECASIIAETDEWNITKCIDVCKDGVLKVGSCYGGAPIVMTPPHFYRSHESLLASVEGMTPGNEEEHDTILDVEPITGATMSAHKRIQINLPLVKVPEIDLLKNVPELVFPIFWADENAELDQANADDFKSMVLAPIKIVDGVSIGLGMVVGSILFILGTFFACRK